MPFLPPNQQRQSTEGSKVKRPILYNHTKFRKDRSSCSGDITIFVIFKMGGRRHLGF